MSEVCLHCCMVPTCERFRLYADVGPDNHEFHSWHSVSLGIEEVDLNVRGEGYMLHIFCFKKYFLSGLLNAHHNRNAVCL